MLIDVDRNAGFCFGVANAISIAEVVLEEGGTLYCLGELVHNQHETKRLVGKGMRIIDQQQFNQLKDCKVLIRAHGEPPTTYHLAEKNNIQLIDATCPIVRHLQCKIRKRAELIMDEGGQIVIFGKKNHPEVLGLAGQVSGEAIVISSAEEVDKINPAQDVYLYAQTTADPVEYERIASLIEDRLHGSKLQQAPKLQPAPKLFKHNTVCLQVTQRVENLQQFSKDHDVILLLSGKNSSNGKFLFEVCKNANSASYLISHTDEIEMAWFREASSVGISGATSTPLSQLVGVSKFLQEQL